MTTINVMVPDIGDYQGVPVIEVLVKDGDVVEKDATLMVLESDKATLEVPAPAAGVVRSFKLKANDKVSQGDLICQLETAEAAKATTAPAAAPRIKVEPSKPAEVLAAPTPVVALSSVAASSSVKVLVPDIGDYKGVPVIEVLVKDGDSVEKDAPLMVLESDKATMEVPAPAAGVVRGFKLKANDKVTQGDFVCELEVAGAAVAAPVPTPVAPTPVSAPSTSAPVAPTATLPVVVASATDDVIYAGPATRKFARQLGVDLLKVNGSGPRGRIVIDDVQAYVKHVLATPGQAQAVAVTGGSGIPPIPAVDFSKFGEIETKALSRIRKLSAAHLHRSWLNVPHVTQNDEADITEVEAFRKAASDDSGVKLTMLPFIMKALSKAMEVYPEFNSSLSPDGDSLILKKYCHIGFAADTENGLVVPVIRDVDKKGVAQLAKECGELAKKARDGKLKPDDMKGGCFSISSLGGIGGSHFTPIVNAPEVAILGASRAQIKPVWDGTAFQPRLMLPLSLSYDHRVIDGASAARFIVLLVKLLSDVRRLAL